MKQLTKSVQNAWNFTANQFEIQPGKVAIFKLVNDTTKDTVIFSPSSIVNYTGNSDYLFTESNYESQDLPNGIIFITKALYWTLYVYENTEYTINTIALPLLHTERVYVIPFEEECNCITAPVEGGSGSVVWGGIGGTLSSQTDLQAALDNKVDKEAGKGLSENDFTDTLKLNYDTHIEQATESLRGTLEVSTQLDIEDSATTNNTDAVTPIKFWYGWSKIKTLASQLVTQIWEFLGIDFTNAANPAYKQGRMFWNDTDKTISFYDNISNTSIELGQEIIVRARNSSGSTITNGQVVYISGATGQNPVVSLAKADTEVTSYDIGMATHDIANNTIGKITVIGIVKDVDTSAFNNGDIVYLSASTAGALTNVAPSSPNYSVFVGYIAYSHITQGKVLVHPGIPLAANTSLGTSNKISPTQNAVKTYSDSGIQTLTNKSIDYNANTLTNLVAHRKIVSKRNTDIYVTGTLLETVIDNIALPANSMGANDIFMWQEQIKRDSGTSAAVHRLYISTVGTNTVGTTGTPASSTLIATYSMPNSTVFSPFNRQFANKNNVALNEVFSATTSANTDGATSTNTMTTINANFGQNLWIVRTIDLATSGDNVGSANYQLYINKI